jgi:mRNA-degrading endonuclease RelE of RelBE toxin-antitoxin system
LPRFQIDLSVTTFIRDLTAAKKTHKSITEDLKGILASLENDHTIGEWIPGIGYEVRKVRIGVKKAGIGKSKGYRLIYFVDQERNIIRLLLLHYKPDIPLIPNNEIAKAVKAMAIQLLADASGSIPSPGLPN